MNPRCVDLLSAAVAICSEKRWRIGLAALSSWSGSYPRSPVIPRGALSDEAMAFFHERIGMARSDIGAPS